MKAQRRRFVVEVKRGTNRASFLSQDAGADRFSSAEDALFGPRRTPVFPEAPAAAQAMLAAAVAEAGLAKPPVGRILPDLHEPPPPPLPDLPLPARRGRKPGSKNKPKPVSVDAMPPKRAAAAMRAADAAERRSTWPLPPAPETIPAALDAKRPEPSRHEAAAEPAPAAPRSRLRDRSTILKRYVLGTEPAPGQPGWLRAKRAKRSG